MLLRVEEEEDAVPALLKHVGSRKFIRIDGHSCHGKSRLAKALSAHLAWPRVEVDRLLNKSATRKDGRTARFTDMVRRDALAEELEKFAATGVILDGIWLDHLVGPGTFDPELRVYVRSYFAPQYDAEERERQIQLRTDVYHRLYRPQDRAEVVVIKLALKF